MEYRQLVILVRQRLAKKANTDNRVKNTLCNNLNFDGFVNIQKPLLKLPTRERHNCIANGIGKQLIPPEQRQNSHGTVKKKEIGFEFTIV